MSESSDDFSLFARFKSTPPGKPASTGQNSGDDDDPDWFTSHEPQKPREDDGGVITLDSDSDDAGEGRKEEAAKEPSGSTSTFKRKDAPKEPGAPPPALTASADRRGRRTTAARKPIVDLSDDTDDESLSSESEEKAGRPSKKGQAQSGAGKKAPTSAKRKAPEQNRKPENAAPKKGVVGLSEDTLKDSKSKVKPGPSGSKPKTPAATKKTDADTMPSSATQTKTEATPKSEKAVRGGAPSTPLPAGLEVAKGDVIVTVPEKLNRSKLLVELENKQGPEGLSSADLSGDAGAVGRLIVGSTEDGKQEVHVDLKGVLYSATLVPAPGTLCVLSVGPSEAKVEAMVTAFAQLREESTFAMAEAVMEGDLSFLDADEDDFAAPSQEKSGPVPHGGKATGKKGGPGKLKAKAKPKPNAAKGGKSKVAKSAKPKGKPTAARSSAKGSLGAAKKAAGVRKK